jgi:hypothetical protein
MKNHVSFKDNKNNLRFFSKRLFGLALLPQTNVIEYWKIH